MGIRGFYAEAEYLYSCYTILTVSTSILVFLITLNLFFIGKTMAKSALLFLKNLIFLHTYHNVLIMLSVLYFCLQEINISFPFLVLQTQVSPDDDRLRIHLNHCWTCKLKDFSLPTQKVWHF